MVGASLDTAGLEELNLPEGRKRAMHQTFVAKYGVILSQTYEPASCYSPGC